jgi:glycosyltransferase-like protein LARGE
VLRNAAFNNVQTDYAFLVDADFIPCPNMESKLEHHLNNLHRAQFKFYDSNKIALVIPAFEYIEDQRFDDSIPKTKEEFMQLIFREDPIIQPFRIIESVESHRLTNYWRWYISNKAYEVINGVKSSFNNRGSDNYSTKPNGYSDKYEPYLIIKRTSKTPLFDERFTGYGMNKVTFITELFASK